MSLLVWIHAIIGKWRDMNTPKTANDYASVYALCTVGESFKPQLTEVCARIRQATSRYSAVSLETGVPWYLVAALHYRESSLNFNTFLQNGDPLFNASGEPVATIHVPVGVGPFPDWQHAAIAALRSNPGRLWDIGDCLMFAERYNGLGYQKRGIMTPYVWAGTDRYTAGKYVADGVFSATTVDQQLGVAPILKTLGIVS